jgi:GTPase SAR1 family protein
MSEKVVIDLEASAAASAAAAGAASAAPSEGKEGGAPGAGAKKKPVACIVLGMAGSGKTTLMQRLNAHVHEKKWPSYLINLDPAVADVPFGCHIDIRDTVKYKEVMKQYGLGPNGGIMTALNLFATRFDQVMELVDKKAASTDLDYILLDTPGQIEVFTWSASGSIITETFACTYDDRRREERKARGSGERAWCRERVASCSKGALGEGGGGGGVPGVGPCGLVGGVWG